MVRASARLLGFSTPQPPRSKYSPEVRMLCLTGASDRKPYDSGTPQSRNCLQCGGVRTVIERLAFREGRAGEWYRCCTQCRNINFPPQPGTSPELLKRIEAARGRSSALSSASSRRRRVRGTSAPEIGNSRRAVGSNGLSLASLNLDAYGASAVISAPTVAHPNTSGSVGVNTSLLSGPFGPPSASEIASPTPLDKCVSRLNDEMVARALEESFHDEGARIKKRRLERVELQKIEALNVFGVSNGISTPGDPAKPQGPPALDQQAGAARGLVGLAEKPRTLHVLIKDFLELSQEMGVPITMPSAPSHTAVAKPDTSVLSPPAPPDDTARSVRAPGATSPSPLDQRITILNDEMLAHGLQASLDVEASSFLGARRREGVQPIRALNVAGPSKMTGVLEALATKPRSLELLIKEFLELSQGMGVPIPVLNDQSGSKQVLGMQEPADEDKDSVIDTPTPAARRRPGRLNAYVIPTRVKAALARESTSVQKPRGHAAPVGPQEIIEISSGSEPGSDDDYDDDNHTMPKIAPMVSRAGSTISLTDSEPEDPRSESDDEEPTRTRKPIIRRVTTPSDVIELTDSESVDSHLNPNLSNENMAPSGLDVSTLTRTHRGLVASRSPTCLTDLIPSDSSSEATDLFAEGAEDGDPYVSLKAKAQTAQSQAQQTLQVVRRSAAPQLSSPAGDDFIPFGDIYRFEIYPSLANLADGPLPVFNQATQWMLMVKIWYDDDLPPATKMITLDQRRCEVNLAMYHIVRRIFDSIQIYQFQMWNPATTDWRLHALTADLEVSVEPGYHTVLIRLPFVSSLTAWPEIIGQTYGPCTTIERPPRKGKERVPN